MTAETGRVARSWIYFKDRAKSFADGLDVRSNKRKEIQDDSKVWLVRNWKDRVAIHHVGEHSRRSRFERGLY